MRPCGSLNGRALLAEVGGEHSAAIGTKSRQVGMLRHKRGHNEWEACFREELCVERVVPLSYMMFCTFKSKWWVRKVGGWWLYVMNLSASSCI